jgi:hypothetical protein
MLGAYGPYCGESPGLEIKSFAILDGLFEIPALEALDMAVSTVFGSAKVQFLGAPGRKLRGLGGISGDRFIGSSGDRKTKIAGIGKAKTIPLIALTALIALIGLGLTANGSGLKAESQKQKAKRQEPEASPATAAGARWVFTPGVPCSFILKYCHSSAVLSGRWPHNE